MAKNVAASGERNSTSKVGTQQGDAEGEKLLNRICTLASETSGILGQMSELDGTSDSKALKRGLLIQLQSNHEAFQELLDVVDKTIVEAKALGEDATIMGESFASGNYGSCMGALRRIENRLDNGSLNDFSRAQDGTREVVVLFNTIFNHVLEAFIYADAFAEFHSGEARTRTMLVWKAAELSAKLEGFIAYLEPQRTLVEMGVAKTLIQPKHTSHLSRFLRGGWLSNRLR